MGARDKMNSINKEVSQRQLPGLGPRGDPEGKTWSQNGGGAREESAGAREPRGSLLMAPTSLPPPLSPALGGSIPPRQTRRAQPTARRLARRSPCSQCNGELAKRRGNKYPHLKCSKGERRKKHLRGLHPSPPAGKARGKAKKAFPSFFLAWLIKQRRAPEGGRTPLGLTPFRAPTTLKPLQPRSTHGARTTFSLKPATFLLIAIRKPVLSFGPCHRT